MPVVDDRGRRIKVKRSPHPKPKPVRVTTPDQVDRRRAAQRPATPDQQDRNRSPAQKRRDATVTARNVREARVRAVRKRNAGSWGRAVKRSLVGRGGLFGPGGPNRNSVVNQREAKELRRQGVKVRKLTPAESKDVGATVGVRTAGGVAGRAALGTALGFAKDPGRASSQTARGFRDALTGIPSSIASLITDPAGTAEGMVADYERRYGPAAQPGGIGKVAERVSKEGAAAEILDAAAVGTAAVTSVGRALTAPARAGKLGKGAQRATTEARPRKRVSGGRTREQEKSENLFVAVAQSAKDRRKVAAVRLKVARAEQNGVRVSALEKEAAKHGEVVAKPREARRMVAQEKGRDLERMKREQRIEVDKGARRAIGSLSKQEREGFKLSMQLGLPADPKRARAALARRREQIVAARREEGVEVPKTLRKSNDELAVIDRLIQNADRVFTPRLREVVRGEQTRERRLASSDPGLDPVQAQLRRYAPQAAYLGIKRTEGEGDAQYLRRVIKAAQAEGLERPGYFPSQKRPRAGYADRARGGARAIAAPKAYTGELFRTGREVNAPEAFEQGLARNIKRKYNWNAVAKTFEDSAFAWGRNKTVEQLLDELDRRGIDPESVALWNPGRYYSARRRAETEDAGDVTGRGEEPVVAGLDKAVDASAVTIKDLADRPEDFSTTRRPVVDGEGNVKGWRDAWSVIPRAVYDEIHADTRPSGPIARGWDIAKGKQSRLLLGLSPAWLQFQVASNALLSGIAGTGPFDFAKAQAWWAKLPEEQKAAIEPFIGTGHFRDSIDQTKLGAARTRSRKVNEMIDAYRAFKTTPFMQQVGRGNPLDLLFRADANQNAAFRRAVLYSQVKRDAYKRMGQNTKLMAGIQTRFMHTLDLGPEEIMRTIVNDQRSLERHAQYVADFLGDYQTYTAAERRGFQRAVMFYGFLRFSLRFTFMTMPTRHPVMSSVLAQLGRLQADEVRKLLGGDELPWALGKLYFTKDGQLKSIDLARANPAMNAVTNFRAPKDMLGFLPPIVGAVVDQAYAKSGFKQREWRVEGENQPRRSPQGYGVENRVRIFLNQMLSLAAPYRAALNATQPGPKGDDSLLGSARPTEYKDRATLASIENSMANRPGTVGGRLLEQMVPFIPRNDDAPELAASIRARAGGDTGAAPRTVAPDDAPAAEPSRQDLETRLRSKLRPQQQGGMSAEAIRLRRKLAQR